MGTLSSVKDWRRSSYKGLTELMQKDHLIIYDSLTVNYMTAHPENFKFDFVKNPRGNNTSSIKNKQQNEKTYLSFKLAN